MGSQILDANVSWDRGSRRSENHEKQNGAPSDRLAENPAYYKNFLEQLLDLVRNNDQADVSRMVSVIRSGASHEEILDAISVVQDESNNTGQNGHAGPDQTQDRSR